MECSRYRSERKTSRGNCSEPHLLDRQQGRRECRILLNSWALLGPQMRVLFIMGESATWVLGSRITNRISPPPWPPTKRIWKTKSASARPAGSVIGILDNFEIRPSGKGAGGGAQHFLF